MKRPIIRFRWLSNLSLKIKLSLILLLSLLVVFSCTLLTARIPYAAYDDQLYNRTVQMLTLFAERLQLEMDRYGNITYQMLGDNVLQKNLSIMLRALAASSPWVDARREVRERVTNFAYFDDNIMASQLITADGTYLSQERTGTPIAPALLEAIYAQAQAKGGREIWLADGLGQNTLICARNIREVADLSLNSLGVIALRVDFGKIVDQCSASMREMDMPLSLSIYDGELCIYASDDMRDQLLPQEDGYMRSALHGQDILYVAFTSESAGWRFVTALPYAGITQAITNATQISLILSLAAMGVALLLGFLLISSLLRHIQMLLEKFSDFSQGRFPPADAADDPYRDRRDEIGRLHRQFREMADAYNHMIEENYVKQQLLLKAQFHQLRAQVRPHFLFNILESIYCLAQTGGDPRIATMTDALGKMLRASLSDQRDLITLSEDLDIAREYLRIQLLRYGDRLQAEFEVPPELNDVPIPSMTLQPLVENVVLHVVEEMMDVCRVVISATRSGSDVIITVANNGPGMDEQMLEKLETGQVQPEGLGIGLRNIHRRIQLAFSQAYGIRIESREGITRVHVHLPFEKEVFHDQVAAGG